MKSIRNAVVAACAVPVALVSSLQAGCSGEGEEPGHSEEVAHAPATLIGKNAEKCNNATSFSAPRPVLFENDTDGGVPSGNMTSARLSADERTIYFAKVSNDPAPSGGWDLLTGVRADAAFFRQVRSLPSLNSTGTDRWPSVTDDNLTLVHSSSRLDPAGGTSRIFLSQRSSASDEFGLSREITELPAGHLDAPFLRAGNDLWFQADTGGGDIWRTTLTDGTARTSVLVAELSDPVAYDTAPVLTADGLIIFFARTNDADPRSIDIWTASRPTADDLFSNVRKVAELSTVWDEWPTWISDDGCRLYISSERDGFRRRIYTATRTP